jgi:hypothetical protein
MHPARGICHIFFEYDRDKGALVPPGYKTNSSKREAPPSPTSLISSRIADFYQANFPSESARRSPDPFEGCDQPVPMRPYPPTCVASAASSSNRYHNHFSHSNNDDDETFNVCSNNRIEDAYRMLPNAFQEEPLFLDENSQPSVASGAFASPPRTLTFSLEERLAGKKEKQAHEKRVRDSYVEVERERERLHTKWIDDQAKISRIPRRDRTFGLLTEAEQGLRSRLDEDESLREKWEAIKANIGSKRLLKGSKELVEFATDECSDEIICDLSARRIWNSDTTTLENPLNALREKQYNIIGAIQGAEAARLRAENLYIEESCIVRSIPRDERSINALRAEFRQNHPRILFAVQLPRDLQIALGIPL